MVFLGAFLFIGGMGVLYLVGLAIFSYMDLKVKEANFDLEHKLKLKRKKYNDELRRGDDNE